MPKRTPSARDLCLVLAVIAAPLSAAATEPSVPAATTAPQPLIGGPITTKLDAAKPGEASAPVATFEATQVYLSEDEYRSAEFQRNYYRVSDPDKRTPDGKRYGDLPLAFFLTGAVRPAEETTPRYSQYGRAVDVTTTITLPDGRVSSPQKLTAMQGANAAFWTDPAFPYAVTYVSAVDDATGRVYLSNGIVMGDGGYATAEGLALAPGQTTVVNLPDGSRMSVTASVRPYTDAESAEWRPSSGTVRVAENVFQTRSQSNSDQPLAVATFSYSDERRAVLMRQDATNTPFVGGATYGEPLAPQAVAEYVSTYGPNPDKETGAPTTPSARARAFGNE